VVFDGLGLDHPAVSALLEVLAPIAEAELASGPGPGAHPGDLTATRHLAGARTDAREADLRRLLLRFHLYQFDAAADLEGAARIYRRCRQAGITPRGLVDCMIAAVARRHEATLLACEAGTRPERDSSRAGGRL
jgi:predicted nucleic acid-binding protein